MLDNKEGFSAWVAVKKGEVVDFIPMKLPSKMEFKDYREKSIAYLSVLGEVKSGDIVRNSDSYNFVKRQTHKSRGKKEREPVVILIKDKWIREKIDQNHSGSISQFDKLIEV